MPIATLPRPIPLPPAFRPLVVLPRSVPLRLRKAINRAAARLAAAESGAALGDWLNAPNEYLAGHWPYEAMLEGAAGRALRALALREGRTGFHPAVASGTAGAIAQVAAWCRRTAGELSADDSRPPFGRSAVFAALRQLDEEDVTALQTIAIYADGAASLGPHGLASLRDSIDVLAAARGRSLAAREAQLAIETLCAGAPARLPSERRPTRRGPRRAVRPVR